MNLSDLKKRVCVSSIIVLLLSFLIYYSYLSYVKVAIILLTIALSGVALWEYAQFFIVKRVKLSSKTMIALSSFLILSFFIPYPRNDHTIFPLLTIFIGIVLFFLMRFNDISNALLKIAAEFFGLVYIAIPTSIMLFILYSSYEKQDVLQDGRFWILYLVLVTKITDIGAYFIGRLFGRHQLAPLLSPKKTVEGALAGLTSAVGISFVMYLLSKNGVFNHFTLKLSESLYLGLFIGILGQIGDLSESLFKRDALVKDSNKLPGLGGILDMIDSLLFTAPFLYFFLRLSSNANI